MIKKKSQLSVSKKIRNWVQRVIVPPLVAWVGQAVLHAMLFTCRFRIEGIEHFYKAAKSGSKGCFLMMWHDRLVLILHVLLRKARSFYYAAVVSQSRDGEMLAAIARTYRHGDTIRVPHNARHRALKEMIRYLNNGTILLITPDGPRGPQYKIKQGTAYAALHAGVPAIAFSWEASRYWELPTWDKMKIPKPFSKIHVRFSEAVNPVEGEAIEDLTSRLEAAMDVVSNR